MRVREIVVERKGTKIASISLIGRCGTKEQLKVYREGKVSGGSSDDTLLFVEQRHMSTISIVGKSVKILFKDGREERKHIDSQRTNHGGGSVTTRYFVV